MHALLGLSSLLLVVLGGYLALGVLRRLGGWWPRRDLQLLVLVAPLLSLALVLGGLHHFAGRACFLNAPTWDLVLGVGLPLTMGALALGALGVSLVRLVLVDRLIARSGVPAGPELRAMVARLAARLEIAEPRLLVCSYDRPLALTYGALRPRLLLSSWMTQHLDRQELESVIAHELSHVARRDYLVMWLATLLRDAFCYLPTSWAAYRQLRREKELACDDLAASATHRPLALAGALAKVWHQTVSGGSPTLAHALADHEYPMEERIERLLAPATTAGRSWPRSVLLIGMGLASLGLVAVHAANVALLLAPMGCGPLATAGTLL